MSAKYRLSIAAIALLLHPGLQAQTERSETLAASLPEKFAVRYHVDQQIILDFINHIQQYEKPLMHPIMVDNHVYIGFRYRVPPQQLSDFPLKNKEGRYLTIDEKKQLGALLIQMYKTRTFYDMDGNPIDEALLAQMKVQRQAAYKQLNSIVKRARRKEESWSQLAVEREAAMEILQKTKYTEWHEDNYAKYATLGAFLDEDGLNQVTYMQVLAEYQLINAYFIKVGLNFPGMNKNTKMLILEGAFRGVFSSWDTTLKVLSYDITCASWTTGYAPIFSNEGRLKYRQSAYQEYRVDTLRQIKKRVSEIIAREYMPQNKLSSHLPTISVDSGIEDLKTRSDIVDYLLNKGSDRNYIYPAAEEVRYAYNHLPVSENDTIPFVDLTGEPLPRKYQTSYPHQLRVLSLELNKLFNPKDYPQKQESAKLPPDVFFNPKWLDYVGEHLFSDRKLPIASQQFQAIYSKEIDQIYDYFDKGAHPLSSTPAYFQIAVIELLLDNPSILRKRLGEFQSSIQSMSEHGTYALLDFEEVFANPDTQEPYISLSVVKRHAMCLKAQAQVRQAE